MSLVRWLPELAVATAEDVARYGPQAARVKTLLDFLPTMSDEAARTSGAAWNAAPDAAWGDAMAAVRGSARGPAWDAAYDATNDVVLPSWSGPSWGVSSDDAYDAASDAALGSVVSDLISPENYRRLTDPLAAGRAVDILRTRPRNLNTPFLDITRRLAEQGSIRGPRDVVVASRIARSPEDIREIALTLISDGMNPLEALRTASMV